MVSLPTSIIWPTVEPDYTQAKPWALELIDGVRCTVMTGASAPIAGLRVTYGCQGGGLVVGDVDRRQALWQVFYQVAENSQSVMRRSVTTVWY